jgi:hypothetical protein
VIDMVKETVAPVQERLQILENQVEILLGRVNQLEELEEKFNVLCRLLKFRRGSFGTRCYIDLGTVERSCLILAQKDYSLQEDPIEKERSFSWWR